MDEWTPSETQVIATLQYLSRPTKYLIAVREQFAVNDGELVRTIDLTLTVPKVAGAVKDEEFLFIAAQPKKGSDLLAMTLPSEEGQCQLITHEDHLALTVELITFRYYAMLGSVQLRASSDDLRDLAQLDVTAPRSLAAPPGGDLEALIELPRMTADSAKERITSLFTAEGKLRSLTAYSVDLEHATFLYNLCQIFAIRWPKTIRVPVKDGRASLRYSYTQALHPTVLNARARLRQLLNGVPAVWQFHAPLARVSPDYRCGVSAPADHYFDEQSVVTDAKELALIDGTQPNRVVFALPRREPRKRRAGYTGDVQVVGPEVTHWDLSSNVLRAERWIQNGYRENSRLYLYYKVFEKPYKTVAKAAAAVVLTFIMMLIFDVWAGVRTVDVPIAPTIFLAVASFIMAGLQFANIGGGASVSPVTPRLFLAANLCTTLIYGVWLSAQTGTPPWSFAPGNYELARFVAAMWVGIIVTIVQAIGVIYLVIRVVRSSRRFATVEAQLRLRGRSTT